MFGGFFATNVGHFRFGLLDGWRLAFHFVALISLICSLMVLKFAADPRKKVSPAPPCVFAAVIFTATSFHHWTCLAMPLE
jgi:predicted MFS family arabinose efflux permease